MKCPRCKKLHDVLQYIRLETIEEFQTQTVPCYKCPSCKWIFAVADEMPQDIVLRFKELIDDLRNEIKESKNAHDR